jgi:hypothetical protein
VDHETLLARSRHARRLAYHAFTLRGGWALESHSLDPPQSGQRILGKPVRLLLLLEFVGSDSFRLGYRSRRQGTVLLVAGFFGGRYTSRTSHVERAGHTELFRTRRSGQCHVAGKRELSFRERSPAKGLSPHRAWHHSLKLNHIPGRVLISATLAKRG